MSTNSSSKQGRPRKGDPPRLPYDKLDRILVFGEVVECEDGQSTTVVYPSYRELAERYGVAHSLIAQYSRKHNCLRRREQAQARIQAQADQKLVELRATAVALSRDDELRIIDSYLAGFEQAVAEGRVRFDNPTDFNTLVRLKAFLQGGPDSRQEVHASLSLEDIQARHQRMLRLSASSPAERGEQQHAHTVAPLEVSEAPPAAEDAWLGQEAAEGTTEPPEAHVASAAMEAALHGEVRGSVTSARADHADMPPAPNAAAAMDER